MSVSSTDVLRNSFGILKNSTGQKLLGIFFVLQVLNFASTYLIENMSMTAAGAAISILAGVGGILATLGGLRSLREDEVALENFRENLIWPVGRIVGANLIIAGLAYLVSFLFFIPAVAFALTSGITSLAALNTAGAGVLILGALGALLGVAAFFYVSVSLILAQPFIAIDDKRMFQALDDSVQKTKGNRLGIFATLLGLILVYIGFSAILMIGGSVVSETVATAAVSIIGGSVMAPVSLKILEEFSRELS